MNFTLGPEVAEFAQGAEPMHIDRHGVTLMHVLAHHARIVDEQASPSKQPTLIITPIINVLNSVNDFLPRLADSDFL